MHRQDQQLSEGFESNQTIIEQGLHSTTNTYSLRPTDFAPRVLLRSRIHKKLPEQIDRPVSIVEVLKEQMAINLSAHSREERSSKTPWEVYESNRDTFRLVYSKQDCESVFGDREEDFTNHQLPLKHLLRYQQQNYSLLRPYEQSSTLPFASKQHLIFDSRFQCANLLCAYQSLTSPNEYHLFMENDTNRFGYNQWFYFSLRGMVGSAVYCFKIVNFLTQRKATSFFKYGMKPVIFSMHQHEKSGNGWSRRGDNVTYAVSQAHDVIQGVECKLYCLSFEVKFDKDDDFVTISSGMPYSYSRLIRHMKEFKGNGERNGLQWCQRTIAYTLSNNQVPYLIIKKIEEENTTISLSKNVGKNKKKKQLSMQIQQQYRPIILILARQHPGETHSSFIMQQILKELSESTLKETKTLLQQYQFHIFPMINVDGVIYGNFRCDLAGFDLNRTWRNPLKQVHPQIQAISQKIRQLVESRRVAFCFDLHSHSKQYGIFSYCCKEDEVQARIFPFLLGKASEMFLFPSCTFGLSRDKFSTARAAIASILKHPNVMTIQTSSFAFKDQNKVNVLQPYHFKEFAKCILKTFSQYLNNAQVRKESQIEIKARLSEFQAYDGHNQQLSGSDSQAEMDPREHLKHISKFLPLKTLKMLEAKCNEIDVQFKSFLKREAIRKKSQRLTDRVPIFTPVEKQHIDKPQPRQYHIKASTKIDMRKQQVLAILRTKDPKQPIRKIQEQPIIRMPINSFKVNVTKYQHNKTQNMSEMNDFLSEEEAKLLIQHPVKVKKNRSSLILGSSARSKEIMMLARPKAQMSRFKLKSFEEDGQDCFERVGDRRNMRKMSKIQKILRLRKRASTLKSILPFQKVESVENLMELKVGDKQPKVDASLMPCKYDPSRLKLNKSSTVINRVPTQKYKPQRTNLTNHPNAQTSLIGQLWRINYGRYSKELS